MPIPQTPDLTTSLELLDLATLRPHPRNDGHHPPDEIAHLKASITQHGIYRNVVVAQDGTILAGHGVIQAARALGQTHVPGQRMPYGPDDPAALQLLVGDNHIARLREQNDQELAALLTDLRDQDPLALLGTGYDEAALEALLETQGREGDGGEGQAGRDAEAQVDRAEELREEWGVEVEQLWACGAHRVICGDCTNKAVVERLMQNQDISLVVTDPPYGIQVDTSWLSALHIQRGKPPNKSDDRLAGDDGSLDLSFLFAYPEWLVWGFPYVGHAQATGWLVWDKWPGTDGSGLGNPVEMACSNLWKGFRLVRCMWGGYYRAAGEKRHPHPTQKPLGVIQPFIEISAHQTVYDPFLGSGTTLVACENLHRTCYGCELSPAYTAVCLQRYYDLVGERPTLLES